jgi:hypothetical protein
MRSLWNVAAANLVLGALAFTVSCTCLCDQNPGIGSAPMRRPGQDIPGKEVWRFVVSGDSRNCGDVIMPAIAESTAKRDKGDFYWHLGDLRAIYDFDDDMVQANKIAKKPPLTIKAYEASAWDDFLENQVAPFTVKNVPFRLGIGNHETVTPLKTRCEFARTFKTLLDKPDLQKSKPPSPLASSPNSAQECEKCQECDHLDTLTYYNWKQGGVDFIYLDNASEEQFSDAQMKWFRGLTDTYMNDTSVRTVVVGMHESLPWSVSCGHSMNESKTGTSTGEEVYKKLVDLQAKGKKVYVVSSHSHYYMLDIYNTKHWRDHGTVLPGWIVGTAGAVRYALPAGADLAKARGYTYGYLLGRVFDDGTIDFEFTELKASDVPYGVQQKYGAEWISESCFAGNRQAEASPDPGYCMDETAPK